MKNRLLVGLIFSVVGLLSSGGPVFAQIGNTNIGDNLGDYQAQIQKRASLTCDIDASTVLVQDTVQNDLTFSVDYESDGYVKQGAAFEVIATGKNDVVLYKKTGSFNLNGSGRVPVSGEAAGPNGTTFRFNAKDHGEVKLNAKVDGKACPELKVAAKTNFSVRAIANSSNGLNDIAISGNLQVTSSIGAEPVLPATSSVGTVEENTENNVDADQEVTTNDNGRETTDQNTVRVISAQEQEAAAQQDDSVAQRDYILYGLLGALLVVMITYIVMKKRGSI